MRADPSAHSLTGAINGTIVTAGVLVVAASDSKPDDLAAGAYALATVLVFWIAHGWADALGRRGAGERGASLPDGLRRELPILGAIVPPTVMIAVARILGADNGDALLVAAWTCVVTLGLLGAGIARREGSSPARVALTAAGCAALGIALIALKALVK